jgi:hypothetical protein
VRSRRSSPRLRRSRVGSFIAFKPAHGFTFVTEHGRARIEAAKSWFLPLESSAKQDQFGLRLGVDDYTQDAHEDYLFAAFIVLDTGLGELSAARDIGHVEVGRTPPDPAAEGYLELPELPAFIRWRAKRRA